MQERLTTDQKQANWSGLFVVPWIAPALLSFYLKYILMAPGGGFSVAAQSLGRKEGFGFLEKLSFFLFDIIVAVIVPVILLMLGRFLPRRLRLPFGVALSAGATLALYAQLRAFRAVGQFLSFQMFWTAVSWGWHEPGAYVSYIGIKGLSTGSALGASLLGGYWWLSKRHTEQAEIVRASRHENGLATLEAVFIFCLLPVYVAGWLPRLPSNPYQSSVLLRALSAYWHEQDVQTADFVGLTNAGLLSQYRQLTHAPAPERNPAYWSSSKGGNVIFFVLETMPARFLPADGPMDDLPNFQRLREKSFIGGQHYTTFPRTHEAVFSLLSSWYPSDVTRTFEEQQPNLKVPGIMAALTASGYLTAIYSPMRRWHSLDEEMFREVGVEQQTYPPDALAPPEDRQDLRAAWMKTRINRDVATLQLMKRDIADSLAEKRNFAATFLPQISHFPYPESADNEQDISKRARAILKIEDAWLGELLDLLQQQHQLDNTVIVITGDHGIRTSEEDPNFIGGMIDEYSFHVPLLIYAPKALQHSFNVPWLTSHIDVAPTVLDLLGVERGRDFEEGSPVWNGGLSKRQTYFFASSVFGADGYYSDGRFYMRNLMSDTAYESSTLHFETKDIMPVTLADCTQLSRPLARIAGLQQVSAARFSTAHEVRNQVFGSAGD